MLAADCPPYLAELHGGCPATQTRNTASVGGRYIPQFLCESPSGLQFTFELLPFFWHGCCSDVCSLAPLEGSCFPPVACDEVPPLLDVDSDLQFTLELLPFFAHVCGSDVCSLAARDASCCFAPDDDFVGCDELAALLDIDSGGGGFAGDD